MNLCQLNIHLSLIMILFMQQTTHLYALGKESDRLALLEFKKGITNDPLRGLRSWNDSTGFCAWYGVSCGRDPPERVVALELPALGLRGSVSPHLGNLTFLGLINLSNNSFHGSVPPELGRLFGLQRVYLANNMLSGEIPLQLFNCTELRVLDLGQNRLSGRISPRIGSLTKLIRLYLASNSLTGPIPPSIGNLSSLEDFYAHYNSLEGKIPEEIGKLKNFSILAAGANKLTGELPASLYNMSSLAVISVPVNKLNGTLPTNIGFTLPNLIGLGISNNDFSGPIPTSLSNASKLQGLQLSRNNFVGEVPKDLGNQLIDLWGLGLSSNYLGSNSRDDLMFLASFKNMSKLQILDIADNQFGGVLPASIANLSSQLSELYLGSNQIYGSIPVTFEKYINLNVLNIADNLFTGTIPTFFGKLQNIQGMYFSQNRLSGQIPYTFGNLTLLTQFFLSENSISGSIPPSIGNCKKLQYLDISHNSLTGSIPKEITYLSSLSLLLNLSQNLLTGNLPIEIGRLKNINALDFSKNYLLGEIPSTIGDCESLEKLNLHGNSFWGVIPSSIASLKGLTHLDLSQNKLSGNIPKDLSILSFLSYFNASFNDLEGEMPTKGVFGNATAVFVTGNNKLCGGIPELLMPPCPSIKARKHGISRSTRVIISITSAFVFVFLLSSFLVLYLKRKSKQKPLTEEMDLYHLSKVSYKMLFDATNGFSLNNLIGSGSFGSVYRGILGQNKKPVAIKVFNLQHRGASKSFTSECMALQNMRHRNLVKIITACSSIDYNGNDFKALVFEYIEKSNLDEWLHLESNDENQARNFSFLQRLNVAIDVASAVHYLHDECEPPIVHCDLKPSNVMLNNDMVAHVGDFGLARILSAIHTVSQNQSSTISLEGSIGYAAPEYGIGGQASIEGDVYSYGILLLEIFTGKRPTHEIFKEGLTIHQYVKSALPKRLLEIVDPSLHVTEQDTTITSNAGEIKRSVEIQYQAEDRDDENPSHFVNAIIDQCLQSVLKIGLSCSAEPPKERMKMKEVLRELLVVKNVFIGSEDNGLRTRHI